MYPRASMASNRSYGYSGSNENDMYYNIRRTVVCYILESSTAFSTYLVYALANVAFGVFDIEGDSYAHRCEGGNLFGETSHIHGGGL